MTRRLLLAVLLAAPAAFAATAARLTVVDAQVTSVGDENWLLRVRSSGPQPFTVVPQQSARKLVVRLHGAALGDVAPLGPVPFGTVKLDRDKGDLLVRVTVTDDRLRLRATQGRSPDAVEIRVGR